MNCHFKVETIYNLNVHKEFNQSYLYSSSLRAIFRLLYCLLMLWFISMFSTPLAVYYFLGIALLFLVIHLVTHPKKGDIQYKRILQLNNDEPLHSVYHFCDDGIHAVNPKNGNNQDYRYEQFRSLIESKNLLILVMKHRSCVVLDKRWVQGGTPEELTAFIFTQCTNIKRKKPRGTAFGKWTSRCLAGIFIVGCLIALVNFPGFSLWDKLTGRLHNDMTYQEMAAELVSVDITISKQTMDDMDAYDAEYMAQNGENYYDTYYSDSKVADLLCWEGMGTYDQLTMEWTPSTSGVYWFDSECWNAGAIYTGFLTGLSAMHEELDLANIQEDYSGVDMESGTGTVTFAFDLNGVHYNLDAEYYYDWFDTDVLYEVGRILAGDSHEKDLFFAFDDGQGYLLYYGDSDQVRQLEKLSGLDFHDTVHMLMGH